MTVSPAVKAKQREPQQAHVTGAGPGGQTVADAKLGKNPDSGPVNPSSRPEVKP